MGIPLVEGNLYVAVWFIMYEGGDWLLTGWIENATCRGHLRGRIRTTVDDRVWDSADHKDWFGVVRESSDRQNVMEAGDLMARGVMAALALDGVVANMDRKEINGDHYAALETFEQASWGHTQDADEVCHE